jgi:4-amino-4-deoxy-L-arabinose transferase-like glycosyltransferase
MADSYLRAVPRPLTEYEPYLASRTAQAVALVVILFLAAFLRFYRLDLAEYKLDEANLSRMALDMVGGKGIPLHGIGSSVGVPNGPLSVWLLAIPYAFSRSPIVATGFLAALNVLAVAMTLALARRMFGLRAAWVAGLLFAVAPWAVLNSRKLWAQDLLPPFVVGYLWTAYLAFTQNKRWALVAHISLLSACIQLHYSALTFVPLSLMWMVLFWWRHWPWKVIGVALIVGLVSVAPFAYQMMREGAGAQAAAVARPVTTSVKVDADAIHYAWLMTTGTDLHSLAGPDEFRNFLAGALDFSLLFQVVGVLAGVGVVLALWRIVRRRAAWRDQGRNETGAGFIAATALLFPVLMFTVHTTPVYPHYFILTFPSQFILVGFLAESLFGHSGPRSGEESQSRASGTLRFAQGDKSKRLAWLIGLLIGAIAAAQAYAFFSIQNYVAGRATPGGYGTPLGLVLRAVNAAEQRSREMGNVELIVQGNSDDVHADSEVATFDVLLDPRLPRRFVSRGSASVYPGGRAVYVNRVLPVMSVPTEFALRPGEGGYSLMRWNGISESGLPGLLADRLYTLLASRPSFANGIELDGYHISGGLGGDLRFGLAWRVKSAPPAGVDYHWTNQLFDAEGKRVWQKDDVGFPASSWRVGDLVITDFVAPLGADVKPGAYQMRVGMYTYPDIKTVPTTDGVEYAQVGPIEIR